MTDQSISSNRTSRRSFLKTTAATGGVLAASLGARAYAGAFEEVRVALIGCGGRGTGAAAQALSTSGPVKLVAMADAFRNRLDSSLERLKRAHPEQVDVPEDRQFVGLDAYRKAIDAGVDLVLITGPPGFRPPHFAYAVEQGKHVFMEKPVAVDGPGARRMLQLNEKAKQKNLVVAVGFQLRHQLSRKAIFERVHDGQIGDLIYTRVYHNSGGVWVRNREPDQNEMQYQVNNWYYFNWTCGDHIAEQHVHRLDMINWIKGDYPVRANGMGGREVRTGIDHGQIYDHHYVEFIYDDGTRMISQCRHQPNTWNHVTEILIGTKGEANLARGTIDLYNGESWRYRGENPNAQQLHHDGFFKAIRENEPYNEGDYGTRSSLTAILGRYATYSGQVVELDDALHRGVELAPGIDDYTFDTQPPVLPDDDGRYPVAVPGETQVLKET